jgi:NDP-sugar pyrophosphorylase family protein
LENNLVILAGGVSSRMKKQADETEELDSKLLADADSKSKAMIGVGSNYRPFMDYLLFNARAVGYNNVVIIIGQNDNSIKDYYALGNGKESFKEMSFTFTVQPIPEGRVKPPGTADALYRGLSAAKNWKGKKFTVVNSDNLYSKKALKMMLETEHQNAMIDYSRDGFDFEKSRIEGFAVTMKDEENFLLNIIEKPNQAAIESVKGKEGFVGVSMNIFRLSYDMIFPFLEKCPMHPVRNEKELPTSIKMMIDEYPKSLITYPLSEHVPDLTSKNDLEKVKQYLEREFGELK